MQCSVRPVHVHCSYFETAYFNCNWVGLNLKNKLKIWNFECNVVHVQCTSIVVILTPPKVMVLSWQTRLNHDTTFTTISARYGVCMLRTLVLVMFKLRQLVQYSFQAKFRLQHSWLIPWKPKLLYFLRFKEITTISLIPHVIPQLISNWQCPLSYK